MWKWVISSCLWLKGRADPSASTARPTPTQSVASAPAACAAGSRTLTCSCCVMSATWRSTSTASTLRWPPSQMTRTGERATESGSTFSYKFAPLQSFHWLNGVYGLKCTYTVIQRWLMVKSILNNWVMHLQVAVNFIHWISAKYNWEYNRMSVLPFVVSKKA